MSIRASDIARMEAKDLSRWAPKPQSRKAAIKANDVMGLVIPSVMTHGGREKGADAAPKINDLIRLGAAQRLTDDPRIKQLLQ